MTNLENLNYYNNQYLNLSPLQEADLSKIGVPNDISLTLDRLLWATLCGDYISRYLTVYEAVKLSTYTEKFKYLPLAKQLKISLKKELGIVC